MRVQGQSAAGREKEGKKSRAIAANIKKDRQKRLENSSEKVKLSHRLYDTKSRLSACKYDLTLSQNTDNIILLDKVKYYENLIKELSKKIGEYDDK